MRAGRPKGFDQTEALDRAMHTFWARGYASTSVPDLLGAMEISRQSLYDTFGSKRALFVSAIEHYRSTYLAEALALLQNADSPRQGVIEALGYFEALASDERGRGCLVANAIVELGPHDPELAELLHETLGLLEAAIRGALERARAAGEVGADRDPVSLARALVNAMLGLVVMGKLRPDPAAIRDVHRGTLAMLA